MARKPTKTLDQMLADMAAAITPIPSADPRVLDGQWAQERSLEQFVQAAWATIEPHKPYVGGWHVGAICRHLEAVVAGAIKNLLVLVPPRMTKSVCTSICLTPWTWAREPGLRFMFASYSAALATEQAVTSRRLIDSPWYQERWGTRFRLTTDQNVKQHYENSERGYRISTSVGGTVTGRGADVLCLDDPHNVQEAVYSEAERSAVRSFYTNAWHNRLNDPMSGRRICIMQRVHTDDLAKELMALGYETLMLPNEYDPARSRVTAIGWSDPRTEAGDLLCPARFGIVESEAIRRVSPYVYAAQYAQNPLADGGSIIQPSWLKRWTTLPPSIEEWVQTWDCAFKAGAANSWVVGQVWARKGAVVYLVAQVRGHWDFPETSRQVVALAQRFPQASRKLIEDKANGPAILQMLGAVVPGLVAETPKDSKEARLSAVAPFFEAGNVFIPDDGAAGWVNEYVAELTTFPQTRHSDQVDATSMAVWRLLGNVGATLQEATTLTSGSGPHESGVAGLFDGIYGEGIGGLVPIPGVDW